MDREAERTAFSRAYGYLKYNGPAKWAALLAAVATAVLYVAMLAILWLFADLMVSQGNIPSYRELSSHEQANFKDLWQENDNGVALRLWGLTALDDNLAEKDPRLLARLDQELLWRAHLYRFLRKEVDGEAGIAVLPSFEDLPARNQMEVLDKWKELTTEERRTRLTDDLGIPQEQAENLMNPVPEDLSITSREALWRAYLYHQLSKQDDPGDKQAATILKARLSSLADGNNPIILDPNPQLADHGILSLLVRAHVHKRLHTPVIGWFARWNPWMWRYQGMGGVHFTSYLMGLFLAALVLALLRAFFSFVQRDMAARAVIEATTRLRRAVYHHTFRLGTLAFKELGPTEAVSIFTRHVEAVHDALLVWLTIFVREPIKFALLVVFALVVDGWLALAFLFFAILVWLGGGQVAASFRRKAQALTNRASEQLTLIRETLLLMRLVKVYLMELFNQARVERLLARYARAQASRYRGEAFYRPLLILLGTLASLVLLGVAGLNVLYGRLGVASAIALATALISLYWPLVHWLNHRKFIRRGRESAVLLFKFLDRPGEVGQVVGAEFLPPLAKQVEFDNVTLREPGTGRFLLQDVSFTIKQGQRLGIVGADNQEKHALVYLMPRLLDPAAGEIRFDQYNLRWVTLDSLRAQIGIVLQHNLVFHDTVSNNIGCGDPAFNLPQIIEAAKIAHAHHFIQKLPQGYDTAIGELGHALTVTEKFRIGLARAILRDPALLIIEEPDATLDDETKALLDDTFGRILPGRTVVFLPHRLSTIRSCDQVLFLSKGRIEASGVHRDLLIENPLYRHLHYLEFNELAEQV